VAGDWSGVPQVLSHPLAKANKNVLRTRNSFLLIKYGTRLFRQWDVTAGSFRFSTIYEDVRLPILVYENPVPGESAAFANPHPGVDEELGDVPPRLRKPRNELFPQLPTEDKLTMSLAVEHPEFRHSINQFPFLC
jgi:hypothetical protein